MAARKRTAAVQRLPTAVGNGKGSIGVTVGFDERGVCVWLNGSDRFSGFRFSVALRDVEARLFAERIVEYLTASD